MSEKAEPSVPATVAWPRFNVTDYVIKGNFPISTNILSPLFEKYTGPSVGLDQIVQAASDLQAEYRQQGYPEMSVAISERQIINGVVIMNVFESAQPQILISGQRYLPPTNPAVVVASPPAVTPMPPPLPVPPPDAHLLALTRSALLQQLSEAEAREKDTRVHVVSTNTGPRFPVKKYEIMGNTVLPPQELAMVLTNIDGAFGTNVSFDGIRTVLAELLKAYHERGYVTVSVGLPQQKLTNDMVKVQVTEGRLAAIKVSGNRYFSSNNVMRALPSLHTNMVLIYPVFQAELNRANANRDRQIYPVIGPGPDPGTSALTLSVKDQLPLHAKEEFNNQSTPGTPDLRLNTSVVYDNLWDLNQSLGAQYSFSPQQYKTGNQWNFYDKPLVANYSAFYRIPVGNPQPIADVIASQPGAFGYNEAEHRFNLPPATSGQPEFNFYGSRSTIDTGLTATPVTTIADEPSLKINSQNFQEDLTVNEDYGGRFSLPLPSSSDNFQAGLSAGADFKTYDFTSYKTNAFYFTIVAFKPDGTPILIKSADYSPVPLTYRTLQYLPLALSYNATWRQPRATVSFGLGGSLNTWFSGSLSNLQEISESKETTGYWVVLNPSFGVDVVEVTNWILSVHANGQWADQPLISNEQFGIGGVNSVRGYHEGEEYGDTGWRFSIEQQTPSHMVGMVYDNTPLTIRGSIYMDRAEAYLLDPQGRQGYIPLWGTGCGLTAAVGSHWQAQFLFSVPLISTSITPIYQPFFNFSLSAQF